jgi:hypothetical protein
MTAKVAPNARAPVSPSQIRAGKTLKYKNASSPPSQIAINNEVGTSIIDRETIQNPISAIISVPLDSPSMPSVILTAFANATITNAYPFWVKAGVSRLDGGITMTTAGSGISIKEGTNATMGSATLSSGTVTVSTTKVTANSRIILTTNSSSGTVGTPYVSARSAGTSFTITSTSGSDASTVAWVILEPN